MEPQDLVAFHGIVELLSWQISSAHGSKIKLGLESRAELDHFDSATRRRRNRAGQAYQLMLADAETGSQVNTTAGRYIKPVPMDCWLWGASWSHTGGASIAIYVSEDDVTWWQSRTARDQTGMGEQFIATLVELHEDGRPVNQRKADRVLQVEETMRGGPISRNAAMLLHDPDFQQYLHVVSGDPIDGFGGADKTFKRLVGIQTKKILDHDEGCAARYHALRSEFHRHQGVPF